MKVLKSFARSFIFPVLMYLNVDKLIRYLSFKGTLNIMYHGVVEEDSTYFSPRHITKEQFEKQIIYLKENFEIVNLKDVFNSNIAKTNKKQITISFDDGFLNNLTTALPIIEKHKIPVTFFISGVCFVSNKFNYLWPEIISGLQYFYKDQIIKVGDYKFENMIGTDNKFYLSDYIKSLPYITRDEVISQLIKTYQLDVKIQSLNNEIWKLLGKEEVIKLSKSKFVEIGSHGFNHYNLGEIELKYAKEELSKSKSILESNLNLEVNMIAFPDGSYSSEVKKIAENVGYKYQLAVDFKNYEDDILDSRIMARYGIPSTTTFDSTMFFLNLAFFKKGF